MDLDGEIQSAKKNLVTLCQVSKSGCKETLDKEKMKVHAKKNFLLIEVQNMRTVDTGGHMVKWRDLTVPGK